MKEGKVNGSVRGQVGNDLGSFSEKVHEVLSKLGNFASMLNEVETLQNAIIDAQTTTNVTESAPVAENIVREPEITQCTVHNWKSFFEYRTQQSKVSNNYKVVDASSFDEDASNYEKPFLLTKFQGGEVVLTIQSSYLQKKFRQVVRMQSYHGVTPLKNGIEIASPFVPLYHHMEDMKIMCVNDNDVTPTEREHFDAWSYFFELGYPHQKFRNIQELIANGIIMYDDLWALFRTGDMIVSKDPVGGYEISQVVSVKREQDPRVQFSTPESNVWVVTTAQTVFSKGKFHTGSKKRRVDKFSDSKKIEELSFYPLSHYKRPAELRELLIQRGRFWKRYHEFEPKAVSYLGQAVPLIGETATGRESQGEYHTVKLSASIIVDPEARSKVILQANLDEKRLMPHPTFLDPVLITQALENFTEELYITCPASMMVFSLDNHEWYSVDVGNIKEKEWRPAAFDRLVLDVDKKAALKSLAMINSNRQMEKAKDVIEGKGRGMVFLLHGPPGVGKTLTAEALSELTQRPLLKVNLGRIASHTKWEQALEQIFFHAEDWNAILLIDEAEIVLEERTFERMTHNSWISVFLRKLEYYKGILILTTNLIGRMDKAFESRISFAVQFYELGRDERHRIWVDFITALDMLPTYKKGLLDNVDKWADAEINGRQIRNIVAMAGNLASADARHPRMTSAHIDQILSNTIDFCEYNNNYAARAKKQHLVY